MSNKMYDILKFLCTLLLPALAVLYQVLSDVWGLPYGEQVVLTLNAIAIFIGTLIGISSNQYWKQEQVAEEDFEDGAIKQDGK